MLNFVF